MLNIRSLTVSCGRNRRTIRCRTFEAPERDATPAAVDSVYKGAITTGKRLFVKVLLTDTLNNSTHSTFRHIFHDDGHMLLTPGRQVEIVHLLRFSCVFPFSEKIPHERSQSNSSNFFPGISYHPFAHFVGKAFSTLQSPQPDWCTLQIETQTQQNVRRVFECTSI